jgi:GTPase SAR1 family protein
LTKNEDLGDYIVKYEMWDTAGQERYRSLAQMYYKNAIGACVVFDVTSRDSFEKCQ